MLILFKRDSCRLKTKGFSLLVGILAMITAGLPAALALTSGGSLDATFGVDGKLITNLGTIGSGDRAQSVAMLSDGKFVVAGYSNTGGSYNFVVVRYNTNGTLDTTFDTDGKAVTDIGTNSNDYAFSVAVQADDKIVVAGYSVTGDQNNFAVVRYNTDGSLDTTFDIDGKVITDIGSNSSDIATSVVVQVDGKIVVAGYSNFGVSDNFVLVRYNTNGSLDTTFDIDGKVITDIGSNSIDDVRSVALQADGKIVVAGQSYTGGSYNFVVVRYNTNGSLDTTFDTDGKVITDIGTGSYDKAYSVVVQSDSKIVVAGYSNTGGSYNFVVVRYNTNGSLDTTFDTDGKVITDIGTSSNDEAYSVVVQSDGKVVVSGFSGSGGTNDFVVVRYNTNGSLDTTFDTDGKVITDIGTISDDQAQSVVVQSDGKVVVSGFSDSGGTNDFVVVRYNANGALDATFDVDGKATTDVGKNSDEETHSVVVQADGKIIAVGNTNTGFSDDFVVMRFNTNGAPDTTFDGDGRANTDIGSITDDYAFSVALQADGKIIVAGYSDSGGSNNFVVVRYNTDGSLDTTFDTDGKVITDIGTSSDDQALSVVVQSDGKVVVSGFSDSGGTNDFVVVRYNANGALDATFDVDGKVITGFGATSEDYARSVVMQSDGKIVVAGYSDAGGTDDFVVVRYNTNGVLDTTFDVDGKVIADIGVGSSDKAYSVVMQSDGKIVVAGFSNGGSSNDFAVVRYSNNGSLDSTFDTDGKTATDIGVGSSDKAYSVVMQSDGKIIVAGHSDAVGSDDFTLVRYNATSLSATLGSASTTSSSASIAFTVTGTEAIDCTTLSTTSGVDFNLTGITEITSITQTSPTMCTIGVTSQAVAGGVAVTSTLTVASSFSIGFANSNTRTTLSGTSLSIVVTIPAVVTSVSPTTTIAASTTTTIAAVVISSTKKVTVTTNELPKTGSDSFPLVALAMGLISAGIVVTTRKRFTRR